MIETTAAGKATGRTAGRAAPTPAPALPGPALLPRDALTRAGERAVAARRPVLVSQTVRLPAVEPFELFARAAALSGERFYWERPDSGLAVVGVGAGHSVVAAGPDRFQEVGRAWRELLDRAVLIGEEESQPGAGPLLVGGFAFDPCDEPPATPSVPAAEPLDTSPGPRADLWAPFAAARLAVPRLTVTRAADACWLVLNLMVSPAVDPAPAARRLEREARLLWADGAAQRPERANGHAAVREVVLEDDAAAGEAWKGLVARAVGAIEAGAFEKVVLARAVDARVSRPFTPEQVVRQLHAQEPDCAVFAVCQRDRAFVGATPEQLVRLRGDRLEVDCLAGTIRRGRTPEDDRRAGQELLTSAKDRAEHAVVVRTIQASLAGAWAELRVPPEPRLRLTRRVQHLHTPLVGRVRPGVDVLALVERLHPTPAVGGAPREAALAFIREHEGFDRGWYAGPIGWVDRHGGGDFVVGIRSALLHGGDPAGGFVAARLFAGCGIVAASDPASELAEAALKLQPMTAALRTTDAP